MRFLAMSIVPVCRQLLGCIHKFNRLVQIDDTGVRTETLDDQAAGRSAEPAGFFKISPHGKSHDDAGTIRIAATSGVKHLSYRTLSMSKVWVVPTADLQ